eukprot:CAMPEP_0194136494 /NCGR_PEP_ID=MMETSP0152-20130528/6509_1 /TAXON_ID=1049557 /ORGANISM="Thalassiothrix antarctica, Strain L6-D1" /LENGTH=314 /DNA_ID=CAMNT_0038833183 /DNA_START=152 /DNA_END=1096 /DNA_ORIENTATION=+
MNNLSRIFILRWLVVVILAFSVVVDSLQPQMLSEQLSSRLVSTKWSVRLDVGLQPGTWMPKRYPGWAESGARLVVDADIEFTKDLLPENIQGESLVGPKEQTGILRVNHLGDSSTKNNPYNPSTFVSEMGTQTVKFTDGGWCIKRPTADVRNAEGGRIQPEGILAFWLDCESGAIKRDVEIFPKMRIFFTTGVWDDPSRLEVLESEYKEALVDLQTIEEKTREARTEAADKNWFDQLRDVRSMFVDSEEYERLKNRKEELERRSPPKSAVKAENGVLLAPNGSLVVKGNPNRPKWMPTTEYLILGTFTSKSLSS